MSGFDEFIEFLEDIPGAAERSLKEIGLYQQGMTVRRMQQNKVLGPDLKKATIKRKGNNIKLVDTGRLMGSISTEAARSYVRIGTEVFYAEFHAVGTKHLPQRAFIYWTQMDVKMWLTILGKEIIK
jgi:phage gpG-like protein